jgi:hypothetical protein
VGLGFPITASAVGYGGKNEKVKLFSPGESHDFHRPIQSLRFQNRVPILAVQEVKNPNSASIIQFFVEGPLIYHKITFEGYIVGLHQQFVPVSVVESFMILYLGRYVAILFPALILQLTRDHSP